MAKKDSPALLNSLNSEMRAGSAQTQAISHAPDQSPRDKLGDMVTRLNAEQGRDWGTGTDWQAKASAIDATQSFRSNSTKAYPVAKTQAMPPMPNAPGGKPIAPSTATSGRWGAASNPFPMSPSRSPVTLKPPPGRSAKQPAPAKASKGGHSSPSLLHSTIRAMEILGEHEGNNDKVIRSQVNR